MFLRNWICQSLSLVAQLPQQLRVGAQTLLTSRTSDNETYALEPQLGSSYFYTFWQALKEKINDQTNYLSIRKIQNRSGTVAHTCNPNIPRRADHLRSGVWDQPGQHGKTLSLPKKRKESDMKAHRMGENACKSSIQNISEILTIKRQPIWIIGK